MTTTPANARDVGIEVAAHAMRNATDRAAVGMSMRARRDLAALAYDAIRGTLAAELDEHRDRAEAANNLLANAEHHLAAARAELAALKATCTCATSYATYEGPEVDCSVHGAVRALAEVIRERDEWKRKATSPL